jgi:hypothetical protein
MKTYAAPLGLVLRFQDFPGFRYASPWANLWSPLRGLGSSCFGSMYSTDEKVTNAKRIRRDSARCVQIHHVDGQGGCRAYSQDH